MFGRRDLAHEAMAASLDARDAAGYDFESPICIYEMSEKLGARVHLNNINMEGMYEKGKRPRIHLSIRRPLVRRAFNCGHELGHHVFKHGSTIDALHEDGQCHNDSPNELIANTFAAFALMPVLGIRQAFSARTWSPISATPAQVYSIACNYGVGYTTLVNHLAYALGEITVERATQLLQATPKSIRRSILGVEVGEWLHVVDRYFCGGHIDVEIGDLILAPKGATISGSAVAPDPCLSPGTLFCAIDRGISSLSWQGREAPIDIRVSNKDFVGQARYRHLEDSDDD